MPARSGGNEIVNFKGPFWKWREPDTIHAAILKRMLTDRSRMLDTLNDAQRAAVTTESGPLLVLAGAGTGKTRVVTFRIARLISKRIKPERILAVTFTNKAAKEMKDRVQELLPRSVKETPEVSTFHSLCVRILRRQIQHLGYPQKFAIYDSGDQESTARKVLREINVPGTALKPSELLFHIGRWKMASVEPAEAATIARSDQEHLAAAAYRRYQKHLRASGAVDFDDLLLLTEQLFRNCPQAKREEAERFDHVMIDEYQDTNGSQYRIVKALAERHQNLCVVGDDDQSIYGWRGAEVQHILRFKDDWPQARVVRLETNYRSTSEILALANRVIRFNSVRHDKTLIAARQGGEKPRIRQFDTETDEAKLIVADIKRRLTEPGIEPDDFAILFRTNEQTRSFETELRAADLPYVLIGGMSFFDRKEVRDILAYIRVMVLPEDEPALLRILNVPPRGVSQKAQQALVDEAVKRGTSAWAVLNERQDLPDFSRQSIEGAAKFIDLIKEHQEMSERLPLVDTLTSLIDAIGYREEIRRLNKDDVDAQEARWAAVQEVVNALGEYESGKKRKPTFLGFLDKIALAGRELERDKERQLNRRAVVLMTMHSAKGLEFPQVYMVGMEEGILPHHRSIKEDGNAIDEERRLCYVGITRAQERLTFSLALTRRKWGKPRPRDPSRFLFEITGQADRPDSRAGLKGPRSSVKKGTSSRR